MDTLSAEAGIPPERESPTEWDGRDIGRSPWARANVSRAAFGRGAPRRTSMDASTAGRSWDRPCRRRLRRYRETGSHPACSLSLPPAVFPIRRSISTFRPCRRASGSRRAMCAACSKEAASSATPASPSPKPWSRRLMRRRRLPTAASTAIPEDCPTLEDVDDPRRSGRRANAELHVSAAQGDRHARAVRRGSSAADARGAADALLDSFAAVARRRSRAARRRLRLSFRLLDQFRRLHRACERHGRTGRPRSTWRASITPIWFHRPLRADTWLLFDCVSPSGAFGRGLAIARVYSRAGDLVASATQECLLAATA